MLAAIGGAEHAPLRVRPVGMPQRSDIHQIADSTYQNGDINVWGGRMSLNDPRVERYLRHQLHPSNNVGGGRRRAIVGIDSLQAACEHQPETYSPALTMLSRVQAVTGSTIIAIVHPVKGWERRPPGLGRLDHISGREADTVLWVDQDAARHHHNLVHQERQRAGAIEPVRVRLRDIGEVDPRTA